MIGVLQRTTVVVAEDHPLMRKGLVAAIHSLSGYNVVAEVELPVEVEELVHHHRPDVLVLDVYLHSCCMLNWLRKYSAAQSAMRTLVISSHEPNLFARFSQKAGAHGFIGKHAPPSEFKNAFLRVSEGKEVWPLTGDLHRIRAAPPVDLQDRMSLLTLREMEVLRKIGRWKSTEEIADELGISPKTVEIHRIHLKQKLGYASVTNLLHFAVNWVEMERIENYA